MAAGELTADALEAFLAVARSLDRGPKRASRLDASPPPPPAGGLRPGDDFNARAAWADVLGPHDWRAARVSADGVTYWTRPGKDTRLGWSATTGKCVTEAGNDLMYVFSSDAKPFEEMTTYSKFAAFALLNHGGDYRAAARDLAAKGYGEAGPSVSFTPPAAGPEVGRAGSGAAAEYWTHDALLAARFGAVRYVVHELVADESVTILGGPQKAGKSWLSIQAAQCVAAGRDFLGRAVESGDVIYLALEDGARRLQDRLKKQGSPAGLPILWYTKFPKLDGPDGWSLLADLAARRPRLLIIDTLAAAKSGRTDESDAGPMADLFNALRELAQQWGIAVLVVHHHGKHSSGDPAHDLRGSSAIGAAADMLLGLYRVRRRADGAAAQRAEGFDPDDEGDPDFYLKVRGRDVEDATLAIRFGREPGAARLAPDDWLWHLAPHGTHDRRQTKRADADDILLETIRDAGEASATRLAELTGEPAQRVYDRLLRLCRAGLVGTRSLPNGKGRPTTLYFAIGGEE